MNEPWEQDWGVDAMTNAAPVAKPPWEMNWQESSGKIDRTATPFDMDTYLTGTMGVESSGGTQLYAATSSARGAFQFTESTWKEVVKKMDVDWTLEDRFDVEKSRQAAAFYVQPSFDRFKDILGREPAYHELYTAHFLGPTGGANVLRAPQEDSISKHVSSRAMKANRNVFYDGKRERTVGEVLGVLKNKFDKWLQPS